jgi:hypothetical protein
VAVYRAAAGALRAAPPVEAPGAPLVALLEAQAEVARRPRRAPAWAAAAVAALALAGGFWAGRHTAEPPAHALPTAAEGVPSLPARLPDPPRIPFAPA